MLLTFLLYLRVSGQFHIIIGLMHLFGYDLPETNRKYMLSPQPDRFLAPDQHLLERLHGQDFLFSGLFPPAQKGRASGPKLLATSVVFVITWALHTYQTFWLRGGPPDHRQDSLFWGVLGLLVVGNVWWEQRHPKRRKLTVTGATACGPRSL